MVDLLNPEYAAQAREIRETREKRNADARAVAARVAAHAEGLSETAALNRLWGKDLAYCTKAYEEALAGMAGFALLDPASPEFTELGEVLETLVVVFDAAMRAANARAGQFAALESRATEIANHMSKAHRRQPPPGVRIPLRAVWSRLQEQLRVIVGKAAADCNISGPLGRFLIDALGAGIDDEIQSAKRRALLAASEKASAAKAKLAGVR